MIAALPRLARTAAIGVALFYGGLLLLYDITGRWITDGAGTPLVWDFLPVYVAGQMALRGHAAGAYDLGVMHQAQSAFIGHDFPGFLGWHYPPLFLIVAALLALLPYTVAFLTWVIATAAGFATLLVRIAGARAAWMGLALPPAMASAMVGQNGFFTAALFAGFLLLLPSAPVAAGLLAAALSYKPQFGLLIPVALIAGGHWRAFTTAALGVVAWVGACALLAPSALAAFLYSVPQTTQSVLGEGSAGWFKLASVFGLARSAGSSNEIAWLVQGIAILVAALLVAAVWRRRKVDFAPKAALLATASLLATPYVYFYDLPVLAVALAFLWRQRSFDTAEQVLMAGIIFCLAGYALAGLPLAFFAILLTLAMTARRVH
jgi:arabinofuranan 3-O-arabinosyltransferase